MLKVQKELLEAETSREVAHMRQMELQYYLDHIGGIQTMATLLAGFAFTAFVGISDGGLTVKNLFFRQDTGAFDGSLDENGTLHVAPVSESFAAMAIISFVLEIFEVASVTFTSWPSFPRLARTWAAISTSNCSSLKISSMSR